MQRKTVVEYLKLKLQQEVNSFTGSFRWNTHERVSANLVRILAGLAFYSFLAIFALILLERAPLLLLISAAIYIVVGYKTQPIPRKGARVLGDERGPSSEGSKVELYVDESYISPGTVLIAVIAIDSSEYDERMLHTLQSTKNSSFYKEYNAKLHHSEDPLTIRSDVAKLLRASPVSAYVLISRADGATSETDAKQRVYMGSFAKIVLARVIKKYSDRGSSIRVNFEQLSGTEEDKRFFNQVVSKTGYANIETNIITKENLRAAIPDYIVGILRTCFVKNETGTSTAAVNARLIQDLVGLIVLSDGTGKHRYYNRGAEVKDYIARGCQWEL